MHNSTTRQVYSFNLLVSVIFSKEIILGMVNSLTPGLNTDDIQLKHYADIISNLFDGIRGTRVYSESEADHIIYVNLSISGPYERSETYNSPSYAVPQGNVVWQFGGPRTYSNNYYQRNMSLTVYDKEGKNIWKVNIYSEGESNDLSYVLRIMCYVINTSVGEEDSKNVILKGNELVKAGKFPNQMAKLNTNGMF